MLSIGVNAPYGYGYVQPARAASTGKLIWKSARAWAGVNTGGR
jgi:hypothetical protein